MSTAGKTKREKILELLDAGLSPGKVAKLLHLDVNRQYVYRVFSEYKKSRVLIYKSNGVKSDKITPGPSPQISQQEQPRLNLIVLIYDILSPFKHPPEGKTWVINGTTFTDVKRMTRIGNVLFRIINEKRLQVFIPEMAVKREDLRHTKDVLYQVAQTAVMDFCRLTGCEVGLPLIGQMPHIAVMENDPYLCELTKQYGVLKLVDNEGKTIAWWDRSKGPPEFETRDEGIAEMKAFAPEILRNLQDRMFLMGQEQAALQMLVEGLLVEDDRVKKLEEENEVIKKLLGTQTSMLDRQTKVVEDLQSMVKKLIIQRADVEADSEVAYT
jgi:hypothetical protein